MSNELTTNDKQVLENLEKRIERTKTAFVEAGIALTTIREQRLYRDKFDSFSEYCQSRWGFSRIRAHQLIEAAEVTSQLLTVVNIDNEKQARAIAQVSPEKREEVLIEAKERGNGKVTASLISTVSAIKDAYSTLNDADRVSFDTWKQSRDGIVSAKDELAKLSDLKVAQTSAINALRSRDEALAQLKESTKAMHEMERTIKDLEGIATEKEKIAQVKTKLESLRREQKDILKEIDLGVSMLEAIRNMKKAWADKGAWLPYHDPLPQSVKNSVRPAWEDFRKSLELYIKTMNEVTK